VPNKETAEMNQEDTTTSSTAKRSRYYAYLSKKMIVECHPGDRQEPLHLIRWWKRIFELLDPPHYDPNHCDRIHLRCLCNMFNAALKPPPKGRKGKWTEFPHPNHPSLESLIARCHQLYDEDPRRAPTIIFIKEGEHHVAGRCGWKYLEINYPMKIIGAGRDKTTIHGGFFIAGTKKEGQRVELTDMTSSRADYGLYNNGGLSFFCDSMTFTHCVFSGVCARNTKGTLINCVVAKCGESGIECGRNILMVFGGSQTKVDGNVADGDDYRYGLETYDTSSIIHLLLPLTEESVFTNNHSSNDQNYDGAGTIQTVATLQEQYWSISS
jgi:hypothetical protein